MKQTIIIISLAVIVVTAFLWYRSCQDNLADYWQGQYEEVSAAVELERSQFLDDIEAMQKTDQEKDRIITELKESINDTETAISHKDEQLAQLEATYSDVLPELTRIDNLQKQIVIYKEKCTDLQNTIEKKDKIILNLQEKYDIQVGIANAYRSLYENELKINGVLKKNLSVLTKQYKVNNMVDKIKNALILSAVGYITYDLVKD